MPAKKKDPLPLKKLTKAEAKALVDAYSATLVTLARIYDERYP